MIDLTSNKCICAFAICFNPLTWPDWQHDSMTEDNFASSCDSHTVFDICAIRLSEQCLCTVAKCYRQLSGVKPNTLLRDAR